MMAAGSSSACQVYRKYVNLQPARTESLRFFAIYRNGNCIFLNAVSILLALSQRYIPIILFVDLRHPHVILALSIYGSGCRRRLKLAGRQKSCEIATSYVLISSLTKLKKIFLNKEYKFYATVFYFSRLFNVQLFQSPNFVLPKITVVL